ncbi:MAG: Signal transduction histidine kinase [Herbaspirillum sp.]|jgi:uncharacterized integral membrane protein|nr:Signal transduction histidine kinase [Herbaspirillum sp.]
MNMKFRTTFLIAVLAILAIFVAVNWTAFIAPTTLSLLFAEVQAPIGLVMLGVTIALVAIFLVYLLTMQTSVLLEHRRISKELDSQRGLADQAELSRLTELRGYLQTELHQIALQQSQGLEALNTRLNALQQALGERIANTENAVAAQLGELDDRLQRSGVNPLAPALQSPL